MVADSGVGRSASVLVPFLPGESAGPATWFIGTLCLWLADAFFIPNWVRAYQTAYAEAASKLQTEDMAEELTIPLLRAAQKHGGTLTVTQAVLATGLPFADVEKCLTELSTTGYVEIENTDDGSLLFVFGDLPEPEPGELEAYAEAEANALALAEVEVTALAGFRIWIRYSDDIAGEVDLSHLAGRGVFQAWNDPRYFERVHLGPAGAIAWGEEIELCPDALYMQLTGKSLDEVIPGAQPTASHA